MVVLAMFWITWGNTKLKYINNMYVSPKIAENKIWKKYFFNFDQNKFVKIAKILLKKINFGKFWGECYLLGVTIKFT